MMRLLQTLLAALAHDSGGLTRSKDTPDLQAFVTEPNFTAVSINVLINHHAERLAPGYIFLSPYRGAAGWGPQIFDIYGELIWDGGDTVKHRAIDLQPCLFNSSSRDHLCYNDALPVEQGGHSSGAIRVFDNTYNQIGDDYGAAGDLRGPDIHELNTPVTQSGSTFLQDIYQVRSMNLSSYGGPWDGYILDGCFQEIDFLSRNVVFQWCSLEHIPINVTYVYPAGSGAYTIPGLAGNGSVDRPWDWFHINSIDRNAAGDYLVSSRHTNTIFHIAGARNQQGFESGEVIWYLGGKLNSFAMEKSLNFSAQHTIRYHGAATSMHMGVILFDNACEGRTSTANTSSGIVVDLDLTEMRASLVSRFWQPSGYVAEDQGNLQMLSNGHAFLGWGHCNYFSEHAPSGEVLYYAQFGGKGDCNEIGQDSMFVSSFRAWKFPWIGHPKSVPKLSIYAATCLHRLYAYVSWNGATEVSHWAFYGSNHSSNLETSGSFKHITTISKLGFETTREMDFALNMYVQALDSSGEVLGVSPITKPFVPKPRLDCTKKRCQNVSEHIDQNSVLRKCISMSKAAKNAASKREPWHNRFRHHTYGRISWFSEQISLE